jgi:hypothetical protein
LLLVRGMTPDIYYGTSLAGHAGLRDCVSARSAGGWLDINTARPETMVAVGVDPSDAEAIVRRRQERPILDPNEFVEIQKSLGPAGLRLGIGGATMYTFRATVRLAGQDGRLSDFRRTVSAQAKRVDTAKFPQNLNGWQITRWYDRD